MHSSETALGSGKSREKIMESKKRGVGENPERRGRFKNKIFGMKGREDG